jgi:hypothetical protein
MREGELNVGASTGAGALAGNGGLPRRLWVSSIRRPRNRRPPRNEGSRSYGCIARNATPSMP